MLSPTQQGKTMILPGSIVKVFNPYPTIFKSDSWHDGLYMKAIVIRRYGYISEWMLKEYGKAASRYPDCIDVVFEDGRLSRKHFTSGAIEL